MVWKIRPPASTTMRPVLAAMVVKEREQSGWLAGRKVEPLQKNEGCANLRRDLKSTLTRFDKMCQSVSFATEVPSNHIFPFPIGCY